MNSCFRWVLHPIESVSQDLEEHGYGNIVEQYEKILDDFIRSGGSADVILNNYMNVSVLNHNFSCKSPPEPCIKYVLKLRSPSRLI